MPRKCTICSHRQRRAIDRAIAHGKRDIAAQFGVTRSAISRHRAHIAGVIAKAKGEVVNEAMNLLRQIEQVARDAARIARRAEREGKLATALKGLQTISNTLELIGRFSGELKSGMAVNVGIAVGGLSPEEEQVIRKHRERAAMSDEERARDLEQTEQEIIRLEAAIARFGKLPAKHLTSGNSGKVISPALRGRSAAG